MLSRIQGYGSHNESGGLQVPDSERKRRDVQRGQRADVGRRKRLPSLSGGVQSYPAQASLQKLRAGLLRSMLQQTFVPPQDRLREGSSSLRHLLRPGEQVRFTKESSMNSIESL